MPHLPKKVEVVVSPSAGKFVLDKEFLDDVAKLLSSKKAKELDTPGIPLSEDWVRENLAGGSQMGIAGIVETLNRKLKRNPEVDDLHFFYRTNEETKKVVVYIAPREGT